MTRDEGMVVTDIQRGVESVADIVAAQNRSASNLLLAATRSLDTGVDDLFRDEWSVQLRPFSPYRSSPYDFYGAYPAADYRERESRMIDFCCVPVELRRKRGWIATTSCVTLTAGDFGIRIAQMGGGNSDEEAPEGWRNWGSPGRGVKLRGLCLTGPFADPHFSSDDDQFLNHRFANALRRTRTAAEVNILIHRLWSEFPENGWSDVDAEAVATGVERSDLPRVSTIPEPFEQIKGIGRAHNQTLAAEMGTYHRIAESQPEDLPGLVGVTKDTREEVIELARQLVEAFRVFRHEQLVEQLQPVKDIADYPKPHPPEEVYFEPREGEEAFGYTNVEVASEKSRLDYLPTGYK